MSAIQLPQSINARFIMEGAAYTNLTLVSNKLNSQSANNRFKAIVSFPMNDDEASNLNRSILKAIVEPSNEL